jgi:plastocyanin
LGGADAGNYHLTNTSDTDDAVISAKAVTPVIVANDKEFDNSTTATLSSQTVTGVIAPDVVTLVVGGTVTFFNKNVGTWTVTATGLSLGGADAGNYTLNGVTSATDTATIYVRDDAVTRYIGQIEWMTSGTSSTTAKVTLTASVSDPTGLGLAGATVSFIDISNPSSPKVLASGIPVSPVPGYPESGTANTIVTLSSGQYGSDTYVIQVVLGGNYTNDGQAPEDKTATVVVSKPAATNEVTGGGVISPTGRAVAGKYGITSLGHVTYSVGLKYNKGGTNPQGKIVLTIPQANGTIIFIRSNAITSIAFTNISGGKHATIYTKANIERLNLDSTITSLESSATIRVDIDDYTLGGNKIGFTVLSSKTSELYYSNDWYFDAGTKTWKTRMQPLASGSIEIGG